MALEFQSCPAVEVAFPCYLKLVVVKQVQEESFVTVVLHIDTVYFGMCIEMCFCQGCRNLSVLGRRLALMPSEDARQHESRSRFTHVALLGVANSHFVTDCLQCRKPDRAERTSPVTSL